MSGQVVIDAVTGYGSDAADYLAKAGEIVEEYRDVPLVHLSLAPHAPYTVDDDVLAQCVELAERWDVVLNIHVHETRAEVDESLQTYGERPLARMDRLGAVSDRLLAAHAVHLTDEEIALVAERGAALVHCPASNLKLASGFARLADWLAAGVRTGLGTDGAASNNRLDLLGDMRLASLLAKAVSDDAAVLPAQQALHAATLGGAQALRLDDRIGSLTPGKEADMIAVDLGALRLLPRYDVASHLVYTATPGDVTDVWVAGEQRLADRVLVGTDVAELTAVAREWQIRIGG
jgi:5-methylthioadenosine/S-adenosylhomocysteine deaminase